MGDFHVRTITNRTDRHQMYHHAMDDIQTFDQMLQDGVFSAGPIHVGAEQELCIVDQNGHPLSQALGILKKISHRNYTNELALYNLEANLDPYPFSGSCFSQSEQDIIKYLNMGNDAAGEFSGQLLMTGILPSLRYEHLQFEHMTPEQRYRTLSESLFALRGKEFEVHLQGVDEVLMSLTSVLFEACNTSFQLHLQIHPDDFVAKHNWSQMIAGPILSCAVNSPLLFGNELWSETRIALFKQSLDTRTSNKYMRKKLPRVYFGSQWLENSASDLWKNDLVRFPLVVTSDDLTSSSETYSNGNIPKLRAIRLHNGTTYTWNRLCYGHDDESPHLRIECRYLPSGPTPIDEIANFVFWAGLMQQAPKHEERFWDQVRYKEVRGNFIKAARTGLNTVFHWFGQPITAQRLILEQLLPMSRDGLREVGIREDDIEKYLSVIERRVEKHRTGASWMVNQYRHLGDFFSTRASIEILIKQLLEHQKSNTPLGEWDVDVYNQHYVIQRERLADDLMTDDIHSVHPDVTMEFARSILEWNNIHHLPIEDQNGDLVGILTDGLIQRYFKAGGQGDALVEEYMISQPISITRSATVEEVARLLEDKKISGLPVVHGKKLIGIITLNDLKDPPSV